MPVANCFIYTFNITYFTYHRVNTYLLIYLFICVTCQSFYLLQSNYLPFNLYIYACNILLTVIYFSQSKAKQDVVYVSDKPGNFEPTNPPARSGPGEGGKPYHLSPNKQNEGSQSVSEYGINMVVSDEIAMDRGVPDTRHAE